jgi:hypothetical protein
MKNEFSIEQIVSLSKQAEVGVPIVAAHWTARLI